MDNRQSTIQRAGSGELTQMNVVLKNTYLMLAMTLIFSAITAGIAMHMNAGNINLLVFIIAIFGLQILINIFRNSPIAIVLTFAFTGFLGWTLGPILNFYIKTFTNGTELIALALGSTGLIFLVLTAISINPKRDFSKMGTFIMTGMLIAFLAFIVNYFFLHMPVLQVVISVVMSLVCGAYIMYTTNQIIRGGERNYIMATIALYVSLYNIFLTILSLLGMFGGNRN